jgi:hypothetical protein
MALDAPPAHAWDWLARQRLVWHEIRRGLIAAGYGAGHAAEPVAPPTKRPADGRFGDVPDWSADHPDLRLSSTAAHRASTSTGDGAGKRDYAALDTRAGCIAALRSDYPQDTALRATVDAVVADVAFLGRLDVPLHELGVRSAPRGMRWWWTHLTGRDSDEGRSDPNVGHELAGTVPLQLRLVDILAGYGDVTDA